MNTYDGTLYVAMILLFKKKKIQRISGGHQHSIN